MLIRSLLFLIIILNGCASFSQPQNRINYTVQDGLPSNTVYAVIQDDQGFIWFGTDAGLSRFDGLEFQNYGLQEGLPDMDILNFYKDSKGRIWMYTYNGKVCYLKDGQIFNSDNDPFLKGADLKSRITGIAEVDNKIFISSFWDGVKILNPSQSIKILHSEDAKNYLVVINKKCYWLVVSGTSFKYYLVSDLNSDFKSDTLEFEELSNWTSFSNFTYANVFNDEIFGVTRALKSTHQFFKINLDKQVFNIQSINDYIPYNIEAIRGQVFLYTSEGIKLINPKNLATSNFIDLKEVTKFIYDFDDNIWFSTLNSGVFFTPSQPVKKKYAFQVKNIKKLYATSVYLYMAYNDRLVARVNPPFDDKIEDLSVLDLTYLKSFYIDSLQNILVLSGSSLFKNGKSNTSGFIYDGFYSLLKDSEFIYHSNERLEFIDFRIGDLYKFDFQNVGKIWDFIKLEDSVFLVASSNGLFSLNLLDLSVNRLTAFDQIRVTSIALDKYDNLWLITNGNGLLRLPREYIDKIPSAKISSHRVENYSDVYNKVLIIDSALYSSTPKGISKFIFDKNQVYDKTHITESYGIEPARVVDIVYYKNEIYIGQENGLYSFDHSGIFSDSLRFPVIVDEVVTSDTTLNPLGQEVTFPYDVGLIQINAKTIYYKDHKNLTYQFKLNGLKENVDWTTSPNNEFLFSNLDPGDYTFLVRAKSINSSWTKPTFFAFKIENVYWRTLWFKLLVTSLVLFLISISIISINRSRKRKQILGRQKIESDLKALKAQINPHFLFNSLNSIHSFILEKENQLAEEYLLKYGKLMRNILNHSDEMSITLNDELKAIKLYIDLEKIRINKPIDFVSHTNNLDVTSDKVPSMIIQPLLENAIWHGIQPSDRSGKIKLIFEKDDGFVQVEIQDNGVGFKGGVSKETPSGIQLVRERIELINELNGRTTKFEIDSSDLGTKITFTYPIDLN